MPSSQQAAPVVFYGSLALITMIPFLFRATANLVVNIIGFIYPTFASVVAIQKREDKKVGQWLVYWVIYASLLIIQRVFDVVLSKIPLYPLFNAIFLIALMHYPFGDHDTLAQYLYYKFLAPNFGKASIDANDALMELAGEMKNDPQGFAGNLINGNDNKIAEKSGNFVAEQLNKVRDSLRGSEDEYTAISLTGKKCVKATLAGTVGATNADSIQDLASEQVAREQIVKEELEGSKPGMLSQMIRTSEDVTAGDVNNNQGSLDDTESAARINLYRKSAGPRNAEKLNSSQEVLTIKSSTDELEEDVDIEDHGENKEGEEKEEESKKEL